MNKRYYGLSILAIALVMLAAACAAPPAPTPLSPASLAPTSTTEPTATATPTNTTAPTATAAPTNTTPPTATTAPTATRTATATTAPTKTTAATSTAVATTAPSVAATAAPTSSSGQSNKVNLDAFMPPGKGRDLLLNNCTSCHSFVCAINGQRSVDAWQAVKIGHRDRVASLSDEDYNTLFTYLETNFNDQKPPPELPPELANMGCQAQ